MSAEKESSFSIRKFDGNDYAVWKAQVEALLCSKQLDSVIKSGKPRQTGKDEAEKAVKEVEIALYEKNDLQVKSLLLLALDNKHAKLVLQCKSSKEIWDRLSSVHEQRSTACRIVTQRDFFELTMQQDEKVHDYISRCEYLYGVMKDIGVKGCDESMLVGKIVSGLSSKFLSFMSIWASLDESSQTLNNLIPRLLAEESLVQKFNKSKPSGYALVGEAKNSSGKNKKTSKDNNKNNNDKDNKNQGKKPSFRCYACKQEGHIKRNCPNKKQGKNEFSEQSNKQKSQSEEAAALIAESNLSISTSDWILDSGATQHMTYDRSSLVDYREISPVKAIRLGNYDYLHGVGEGSVVVRSKSGDGSGRLLKLHNVLYVPKMRRKLLSLGACTKKGAEGVIHSNKIVLRDVKGETLCVAVREGDLYRVDIEEETSEAMVVGEDKNELDLWHQRLGHNHNNNVIGMSRSEAVKGLPRMALAAKIAKGSLHRIRCISCKVGKQPRKTFPRRMRPRATAVGERLHADLVGPINCPTLSGAKHFVLFKDEFSNFRFVHFLKLKSEALGALRKTIALIESRGFKVQTFVSDMGSELTSRDAQELFVQKSVAHETSAPFTPEQNGFIERDNRTVVEAARTMLLHKKLPEYLWGEAVNSAVYILNRLVNKNTKSKTPYELFTGKVPRIDHIRVFGSLALVKPPEKNALATRKSWILALSNTFL